MQRCWQLCGPVSFRFPAASLKEVSDPFHGWRNAGWKGGEALPFHRAHKSQEGTRTPFILLSLSCPHPARLPPGQAVPGKVEFRCPVLLGKVQSPVLETCSQGRGPNKSLLCQPSRTGTCTLPEWPGHGIPGLSSVLPWLSHVKSLWGTDPDRGSGSA